MTWGSAISARCGQVKIRQPGRADPPKRLICPVMLLQQSVSQPGKGTNLTSRGAVVLKLAAKAAIWPVIFGGLFNMLAGIMGRTIAKPVLSVQPGVIMLVKHSIQIAGHATSVTLEPEFWHWLKFFAQAQGLSVNQVMAQIDETRAGNLSSAARVWVLRQMETHLPDDLLNSCG